MDSSYLKLTLNTDRPRRVGLTRRGPGMLKTLGGTKRDANTPENMPRKADNTRSKDEKNKPTRRVGTIAKSESKLETGAEDLLAPPESSDSSEDEKDDPANIKASIFKSSQDSAKPLGSITNRKGVVSKYEGTSKFASSRNTRKKTAALTSVSPNGKRKEEEDVILSSKTDMFGTLQPKKKPRNSYGINSSQKRPRPSHVSKCQTSREQVESSNRFYIPPDLGQSPPREDTPPPNYSIPDSDGLDSPVSSPVRTRKIGLSATTSLVALKDAIGDSTDEDDSLPNVFNKDDSLDSPVAKFEPDSLEKSRLDRYLQPATQVQSFQNYDFDDLHLLTRANELLAKEQDFEAGHRAIWDVPSTDDYNLTPTQALCVCPMCHAPVDAEDLKAAGELNTRAQEAFCRSHQRKTAEWQWEKKGYPEIDWENLTTRLQKYKKELEHWIKGQESHYRTLYSTAVSKGQNRTLHKAGSNLIPGYYGPRGSRVITDFIMNNFTKLLKQRAPKDRVMSKRSVTTYVQAVLVMEVASLLIADDLQIGLEAARNVLEESIASGELMCEELQERMSRRIVDTDSEDDSEADELA